MQKNGGDFLSVIRDNGGSLGGGDGVKQKFKKESGKVINFCDWQDCIPPISFSFSSNLLSTKCWSKSEMFLICLTSWVGKKRVRIKEEPRMADRNTWQRSTTHSVNLQRLMFQLKAMLAFLCCVLKLAHWNLLSNYVKYYEKSGITFSAAIPLVFRVTSAFRNQNLIYLK